MKETAIKSENFARVEFWGATTLFVFMVFFHITDSLSNDWVRDLPLDVTIPFSYHFFPNLINYIVLYAAFLFLNFKVVPQLLQKEALSKNIFFILLVFMTLGLIGGITRTYSEVYFIKQYRTTQEAYNFLFRKSFLYITRLLFVFGLYTVIKYVGLYLLTNTEAIRSRFGFVTRGGIAAFIVWMITVLLLIIGDADKAVLICWGVIGPFAISLYWYSFYSLIPKSLGKKRAFLGYMGKVLLVLLITYLPVFLLTIIFTHNDDPAFAFSFLNSIVQLSLTAPLSWVLFKQHIKGNEELYSLKKELGQTNANFDFLRSQINPHFLFNALNTIYGTAIQENAERTSEGIERLGDMMRFMLQENMQEKISLAREIDYLNNYIVLQRLRTDANPIVKIEAAIEQQSGIVHIAPMLLIPFVENAFKHGISLREPSHIKISVETREEVLYFDVYNSKHQQQHSDPEKNNNGIGLNNVKQRLQLLYNGKHELIIRETNKEFFVHLTIRLSK